MIGIDFVIMISWWCLQRVVLGMMKFADMLVKYWYCFRKHTRPFYFHHGWGGRGTKVWVVVVPFQRRSGKKEPEILKKYSWKEVFGRLLENYSNIILAGLHSPWPLVSSPCLHNQPFCNIWSNVAICKYFSNLHQARPGLTTSITFWPNLLQPF